MDFPFFSFLAYYNGYFKDSSFSLSLFFLNEKNLAVVDKNQKINQQKKYMEGPSLMGQSTNLKIRKNWDSFMARKPLSPKKCNLGRNLRVWVGHLQLQDQIKPNFYIKQVSLDNLLFFFPLLIHSRYSSTQHSSLFFKFFSFTGNS